MTARVLKFLVLIFGCAMTPDLRTWPGGSYPLLYA
jgi:hypothetical protein